MEKLSREYGWTPDQIRDMYVEDIQDYIDIISTRNQLQEANMKKNGIK